MWLLVLFVLIFVLWHFIPEHDPYQPNPKHRSSARFDDCESPAEEQFLRAMIRAYDLKPVGAAFIGGGLKLSLQVEESPYRMDFLANDWLVIEVDGATYHSTPEAISRDQKRDRFFEALGYSVVRIPAKVVFQTPNEAVDRVRTALKVGRRRMPAPPVKNGFQRLSETMTAIGESVNLLDAAVTKASAENSLQTYRSAFEKEKLFVDTAIEHATEDQRISDRCAADPVYERLYKDFESRCRSTLANRRESPGAMQPVTACRNTSGNWQAVWQTAPNLTGNRIHDETLARAYNDLSSQRSQYFAEEAKRVRELGIGKQVRESLTRWGADICVRELDRADAPLSAFNVLMNRVRSQIT